MQWFEYINKRGSLNIGRRLECGFGLLAWQHHRANGGKLDMSDFTPHEDQEVASIDDIVAMMGAVDG